MIASFDWQLLDRDGVFTYFDFFPLGISFMQIKYVKFLYIWLLFWVVGVSWSSD